MKDSKIYASMILNILSSSRDQTSALKAVQQNFMFQGTLRMDIENLFLDFKNCEKSLVAEFICLIDQFNKNDYPYLANISLKPTRRSECHSSFNIHT